MKYPPNYIPLDSPEEEAKLYSELAEGPGISGRSFQTVLEGGTARVQLHQQPEDPESQTSERNPSDQKTRPLSPLGEILKAAGLL